MTLNEYIDAKAERQLEQIEKEPVDTSRWEIQYRFVFKKNDKFYAGYASYGKTECQETDYNQLIEFEEVYPTEKTVIVYE